MLKLLRGEELKLVDCVQQLYEFLRLIGPCCREVYLVTFPTLVFVEEGCSLWTVWSRTLAAVCVLLPGIRLKASGLLPGLQPVAL
ncbi:hypothetical protein Nepgr_023173 [Nepenthes gracilis]|uniref:Uncharacterized protein n=1 Tax=Nepenthes gracilis TaxID=150966 RepID=A0AAD3XZ47_NEPGR|nr:hypothetical protein Nepgr_023173 [Nepenthes gracilis]